MNEKDLFAHLSKEIGEVQIEQEDLTKLSSLELADRYAEITSELFDMGEAIRPKSQKARDLHSQRNAIQLILRSRNE